MTISGDVKDFLSFIPISSSLKADAVLLQKINNKTRHLRLLGLVSESLWWKPSQWSHLMDICQNSPSVKFHRVFQVQSCLRLNVWKSTCWIWGCTINQRHIEITLWPPAITKSQEAVFYLNIYNGVRSATNFGSGGVPTVYRGNYGNPTPPQEETIMCRAVEPQKIPPNAQS